MTPTSSNVIKKITKSSIIYLNFIYDYHVLDEEIRLLGQLGFPQERCINYLTPDEAHEEIRAAWQSREYFYHHHHFFLS